MKIPLLLATSALLLTAESQPKSLPDPRFRPPAGLWEIDLVASKVAKHTGVRTSGKIVLDDSVGIARVQGPPHNGLISVSRKAASSIPPNSWAFIVGHEFAHQVEHLGIHGKTSPRMEQLADYHGARYALSAGFDLAAHIAWTLSRRDTLSKTHGSSHQRARNLAAHFSISRNRIEHYRRIYLRR